MNYNGNMPDWHQFNASQTNEVTAPTQNVNSGHLAFIPGVSPPTLNALSLSSEGLSKHQNDTNYNPRNYQSYNNVSSGANISNNSPLASMAQMQNCISHYTTPNTRNPMLDNLNSSVDPRNTAIANINDDLGYRSNQVPFTGPMGLLNGPSCNLNTSGPISGLGSRTNSGTSPGTGNGPAASPIYGSGPRHGSVSGYAPESGSGPATMGPRNNNINSVHAGKPGPPPYVPCKGLCCNSDPNINYQQFGSYQSNASYRDNVHPPNYQMENRHFGNNCNFRKDNLVGKEAMGSVVPNAPVVDHRRNFTDYKYHKDHLLHRNYSTSSGMYPNYPMQNYNYSTEHQKFPYPMKEHPKTNNMSIPNSAMMKHSEQNFMPQQKYNNKQYQYQNGNMLPKAVPTLNIGENMVSSPQNAYYNSQFARNIPTEVSHECQESVDNNAIANRLAGTFVQNSPPQQQTYQHKIAMQKFSMENHLRELSRIPGYQSHPKYKECIMRYRQLVKLQQSANYQNPVQASRVTTPVNTAVPPINLQFDQNGMLINSNYLSDGIPKLPHAPPGEQSSGAMEKQIKDQAISVANEKRQQTQQPEHLMMPTQNENVPSSCIGSFQKQDQFLMQKDFNQNQLKVQTSDSHSFNTLNTDNSNKTMMQHKASKEFANKPELDVRQFLANWDETDDEENTSNLPAADSSKTTSVVVVSYENVDLSSEKPQNLDISRRNSFPSSDTAVDNDKEAEENVATQDCLTISYSSSEATTDIIDTSTRTVEEGVVKPGSIIHCISNGPDEIPTIHIVDNLEISSILGTSNDQVIETLEKQSTISLFREAADNKREGIILKTTEQHDKDETRLLSTKYDDVIKDSNVEDATISETIQTVTVSINNQELRILSPSVKSNLDVADNLELKKQSSFASEESHNPDDISLPDLPTSECTPISTTLNTPIHSDSEESSQNMEDLSISISTNPIEVMQNSPVISFTQSPINMDPYGQLNNEDKISYKSNISSTHEQDTTINNFDFSADNSKVKSAELSKDKQVKNLGIRRKKVFLTGDKEHEIRVLDTCETLTSTAYELEVRQEAIDSEKNIEYESSNCILEGKPKKKKKLMDSVKSAIQTSNSVMDTNKAAHAVISTDSNINFVNPTGFDNEAQSSKHEEDLSNQQKIKDLNVSVTTNNPLLSEGDLDSRKMIKESVNCVDKCIDRNTNCENLMKAQKKEVERLIQSKHSNMKQTVRDGLILSQDDEQSVCHMTSQYKNYSIAVIKDTVILSDKKSHGITGKSMNVCCDNPHELQLKTDSTKELSVETKMKKYSQNYKKSEVVQKDLDITDGDIKCTTGEAHSLNEYNRNKDKLHQDKNVEERLQKEDDNEDRGISLEQNSDDLTVPEDSSRLKFRKSFVKNANPEFGIQVTNVNLKFKDNDLGKELILGEKGQEHIKDTLESIKIEINVSCAERNLQGNEQNKRLLYEIDDSSRSNMLESHCRILSTEQEIVYGNFDKVNKIIEKSPAIGDTTLSEKNKITNDAATSVMDTNANTTQKNSRRNSLEVRDDTFSFITSKETLTSENQTVTKLLQDNLTCKDTLNANVKENINCSFNVDTTKTKSAISDTAIVDANNKMLTKTNDKFEEDDSTMNTEGDHTVKTQNQCSSFAENSSQTITEAFKKSDETKLDDLSHMLKDSKKLSNINFMELNSKSLSSLNALDFDLNKLEYKKNVGVKTGELDDNYMRMWKKPKIDHIFEDCDMFQSTSGYINPIFSNIDKMEDLHTVPVYTTKDGKISYSPNGRFTHHELMMEARRHETGCSTRKSHYIDTWNNYYNSKFRKFYKKKRHHGFSDQNKYEYKDTKYLYQRKRDYMDDFCGKHHVKYKDYMHSIKNNNAVWSDRFRIERVCSSSDSDEEVVGHNENIIDVNEFKKSNITENKTVAGVSKSHKHEVLTESENKHKESVTFDACSCKIDGAPSKETQLLQHNFLDSNKCIETMNDKDNINCISRNSQRDEDNKLDGECINTEIDKADNTNINNVVRAETNIKNDEVCLLNKDDQLQNSFIFKEKENDKVYTLESTVDVKEQQLENVMNEKNGQNPVLKCQDNFEDHTETSTILGTKQDENSTCETGKTEYHASTEMPENILVSEISKETSTEAIVVLPKSGSKEINDEVLVKSKADFDKNIELVETLNTNEEHVENTSENAEESITSLEDERDDSQNDISGVSNVICTKQEEYESHMTQTVTTNNPQSLKYSVEVVKNNETVNTDLTEVDNLTAKQCIELTDFSETAIHVDEDYTINKSVTSPENAIDVTLPNVKDMVTENAIVSFNNSEDHSDAIDPNLIRKSSVEEEILHLKMYSATMNSPPKTCVEKKSHTEENEQKEEERQLTAFNSSSNLETDLFQNSTDIKIIPKLVIKKTDALISKTEYLLDSTQPENPSDKYNTKLLPDLRPKIPKMIIMKSKSRSTTPIAEILEKNKFEISQSFLSEHNDTSMDVDNSDSESYTLKYKNYESKVPKVKIKLDNISSKDLKIYMKRKATKKNVPEINVKRIKIQENKYSTTKCETEGSSEIEASDDEQILEEFVTSEAEKIPKLKLKKQDEDKILSLEKTKENDTNVSRTVVKKTKKIKEEDVKQFNDDEIRKKYPQYITEKIPKVIIKRTQIGTEFKCEISKSKKCSNVDAPKWQPKVKLERLKILDHIAKDIKQPEPLLNDKLHVRDDINEKGSDHNSKVKLCRSNSASNLSPIKCKQRRFSNPDYTKMDIKSTDFTDIDLKHNKIKPPNASEASNFKVIDSENKNLKRKGKKRSLSPTKSANHSYNDESDSDIDREESSENHLTKDGNDSLVEKREYSSFGTNANISTIEDKYLPSGILRSRNFDDNDNSIIKVDSSDESQTTIELLPASPDSSDNESKNREFESIPRLHLDDAIPTQLELELDLIDLRNAQHLDVLAPKINMLNYVNIDKYEHASHSKNKCVNTGLAKTFLNDFQCSSQSAFSKNKVQSPEKESNDYFYCNDLLVKEVLAAKETLKKCLTQSVNEDKEKCVLRPKTVAEKKQGLGFNLKNLNKSYYQSEDTKCTGTVTKEYKSIQQMDIEKAEENHSKQDEDSSMGQQIALKESQEETSYDCPTASTCRYTSVPESTTISLKATKKLGQITINKGSLNIETDTFNLSNNLDTVQGTPKLTEEKTENKTINNIQNKKNDSSSETKTKEENMPLLVPEFVLNYDSNSDRDSSRSPPVITNQEESDNVIENTKDVKNKVITPIDKVEENSKHSYKDCEMTIADIITQLAYHEKATIKHRRYCNLCERWFPTTSRHRRHLAGYQHRYMELTQRKSIHTLFILFTGKPCPRLLPANVIRNDCSIGELTPLQIAVQDVANYVEPTEDVKTIE
nr:uncharacterized protein LOC117217574 isoform X1 [Megalopta genalis]